VGQLVEDVVISSICVLTPAILVTFVFDLHQNLDGSFDVVEDGQAVELKESLSFLPELLLPKSVNLVEKRS